MIRFTYFLHSKASRTSAISSQPGRRGDLVHLLPALQSEPNVSYIVSTREVRGNLFHAVIWFTYFLYCKASRMSAISSQRGSRPVIRFTYELHCKASRTSAISSQRGRCAAIRFTYFLHCKASRTSAIWSQRWRRAVIRFTYELH